MLTVASVDGRASLVADLACGSESALTLLDETLSVISST